MKRRTKMLFNHKPVLLQIYETH